MESNGMSWSAYFLRGILLLHFLVLFLVVLLSWTDVGKWVGISLLLTLYLSWKLAGNSPAACSPES